MLNPDGSVDDWHEQKTHYDIAFADVLLACPAGIAGIILVFVSPRWGYYLLALISFWLLWANIMATSTSLRIEKPSLSLNGGLLSRLVVSSGSLSYFGQFSTLRLFTSS